MSSELIKQFSAQWLPTGRDNEIVEATKLAATLRPILEEVKKVTPNISPAHLFSFKESVVQIHGTVKKLETDKNKTYKELMSSPDYKPMVDDFLSKVSIILGVSLVQKKIAPEKPRPVSSNQSPIQTNQFQQQQQQQIQLPPPIREPEKPKPISPQIQTPSNTHKILYPTGDFGLKESTEWVYKILAIPISNEDPMSMTSSFKDGVLFCSLLNYFFPNTIQTIHTTGLKPYHCSENLRAFLTGCKFRLGLVENKLFDIQEIQNLTGKSVLQVAETLRNFILVVSALGLNPPPLTTPQPLIHSYLNSLKSSTSTPTPTSNFNNGNIRSNSNPLQPNLLSTNSTSQIKRSSTSTLPSTFIHLAPHSSLKKPTVLDPVNRKLNYYKLAVPIDEDETIYRCVDPNTKRVTIQKLEHNPTFQIEGLIKTVSSISHPYIMKVTTFWYEMDYIYLEMPFYSHCTLREWVTRHTPGPTELQDMFSKILCGLSFLHERGIVHGALSPDNIIIAMRYQNSADTYYPVICGFGSSPKLYDATNGEFRTTNGLVSEYLDIWLFGNTIYELLADQAPVYKDPKTKKRLLYPPLSGISDPLLSSALKCMLCREPHRRASSSALLIHPYFSKSFFCSSGPSFKLLSEVYNTMYSTKFRNHPLPGPMLLEVNLSNVVEEILTQFSFLNPQDLFRDIIFTSTTSTPLNPTTLNSNIIDLYWSSLIFDEKYFEAFLFNRTVFLLPNRNVTDLNKFHLIGTYICKSLVDKKRIPPSIASLTNSIFQWSRLGLLDNPTKQVSNLPEYDSIVVSLFHAQLKALRDGLIIQDYFIKVTPLEFLVHCCGSDEFAPHEVLSRIQFYDFHVTSPTPVLVREYIESLGERELRQFLFFVSSQCSLQCLLPTSSDGGKLHFEEQDLYIKFMRKKGMSFNKEIERVGCGTIEIFEFDDPEEFTRVMNHCISN